MSRAVLTDCGPTQRGPGLKPTCERPHVSAGLKARFPGPFEAQDKLEVRGFHLRGHDTASSRSNQPASAPPASGPITGMGA